MLRSTLRIAFVWTLAACGPGGGGSNIDAGGGGGDTGGGAETGTMGGSYMANCLAGCDRIRAANCAGNNDTQCRAACANPPSGPCAAQNEAANTCLATAQFTCLPDLNVAWPSGCDTQVRAVFECVGDSGTPTDASMPPEDAGQSELCLAGCERMRDANCSGFDYARCMTACGTPPTRPASCEAAGRTADLCVAQATYTCQGGIPWPVGCDDELGALLRCGM